MPKEYTAMTAMERRFHDVCRHVCLPIHQQEIYNDILNASEREAIEKGTKEDVEGIQLHRKENGLPPSKSRTDFDWLCSNGANNISRIAEHRDVAPRKLALDFALTLGLLRGETEHIRMVKQFCGEDVSVPSASIEFKDNKLSVNGILDAEFRPTKASRVDYVVLSFEEAGWRQREIDFSPTFKNRRALRDCVASLNKKTTRLKFKLAGNMKIAWEVVDTKQAAS